MRRADELMGMHKSAEDAFISREDVRWMRWEVKWDGGEKGSGVKSGVRDGWWVEI
jgi:hypothetical protein